MIIKGTFLTRLDLSERSGDPAVLGRGRPYGRRPEVGGPRAYVGGLRQKTDNKGRNTENIE